MKNFQFPSTMETNLEEKRRAASISAMLKSSTFDDSVVPSFPSPYKPIILPRPDIPNLNSYLHTDSIRIAILDSHWDSAIPPTTAAVIVPLNRETDWIFSTEEGQIQLLMSAPGRIARLILIGNVPSSGAECRSRMYTKPENEEELLKQAEQCLYPFLLHFLPKKSIEMEKFHIKFLKYVSEFLVSDVVLETFGPVVGEMMVEDIELRFAAPRREFRRRLRFKRMPNLDQTWIRIIPESSSDSESLSLRDTKFQPDLSVLAHLYLVPMVASLSLISTHLQSCLDSKIRPKALCLGVGGGSLVGFLATQLDFNVVGVEIDQVVWDTAKKYFGLQQCEDSDSVRVVVGDGIEFLKELKSKYDSKANSDDKFDAIMVDFGPRDLSDMSEPPWTFQHKRVISAARSCLSGVGLLVLNVHSMTYVDFEILVLRLRSEFVELYKIDPRNGLNVIVIATMSMWRIDTFNGFPANAFMSKLKSYKPVGMFLDKIQRI